MEINIERLIDCIRYEYNTDIMSDKRERDMVESRMIFSKILYSDHHLGYTAISRILNKNHATIYHYIKSFDNLLKYDEHFRARYMNVMSVYLNGVNIPDADEAGKIMYQNLVLSRRVQELEEKMSSKLHTLVDSVPRDKRSIVRERLELIIKMNC